MICISTSIQLISHFAAISLMYHQLKSCCCMLVLKGVIPYDLHSSGHLVKHKWENCMTVDFDSWGYRRNSQLKDYATIHELIKIMAETVR